MINRMALLKDLEHGTITDFEKYIGKNLQFSYSILLCFCSVEPLLYFSNEEITVAEAVGNVTLTIKRIGDLSHETYVRCFTKQESAKVNEDFVERPNTIESFVRFSRKEYKKECTVK